MLAASARDTVRSKSRTGKPSRQLRSPWTDAWESAGAPKPLPLPLPSLLSEPALRRTDKLAAGAHDPARALSTSRPCPGVGRMNEAPGAGQLVHGSCDYSTAACGAPTACGRGCAP